MDERGGWKSSAGWGGKAARWLLPSLLICQFAGLLVRAAEPEPKADARDTGPIMVASLGWGGTIVGDRWGPGRCG
jgi:hypothetical protein